MSPLKAAHAVVVVVVVVSPSIAQKKGCSSSFCESES